MSTLIVLLPARPRLAARHAPAAPSIEGAELDFLLCSDDLRPLQQGRAPLAALPAARDVVAVLPAQDVAWHRLEALPRAPAAKLRAALAGSLEDALLDEEGHTHLALAPQAVPGQATWVAAVDKPWLAHWISQLETEQRALEAVVPAWAPPPASGEGPILANVMLAGGEPHLAWWDAQGPWLLPLNGPTARALLAGVPADTPVRWTASAEAAAAAEAVATGPVQAQSLSERLRAAASCGWNLRQFELSPRRRGDRLVRAWLRRLTQEPGWHWVRVGLLGLLVCHLLGVMVWTWQQRSALAQRKQAATALLRATFPQVRAVLDAPVQMQQELDALRTRAGRPGEGDLETLLQAADLVWPAGRAPATDVRFEPGRLTLTSGAWSPPELQTLRIKLWPMGLDAEAAPNGVSLVRLRGAAPPMPPALATPPGATGGPAQAGVPPATATPLPGGAPPPLTGTGLPNNNGRPLPPGTPGVLPPGMTPPPGLNGAPGMAPAANLPNGAAAHPASPQPPAIRPGMRPPTNEEVDE